MYSIFAFSSYFTILYVKYKTGKVNMKKLTILSMFIILTLSLFSTNGMNMIGYGPRSSAMGGISLGLNGDINSINTNPAGISNIQGKQLKLGLGLLIPTVNFKNDLNDKEAESSIFMLPNAAYGQKLNDKISFGFGMYSQGGMGATYKNLSHDVFRQYDYNPTTTDALMTDLEYHSKIGYIKIMPSISYKVNDNFALGVSPSFGYAMLEMKMPYSIDPMAMKGVADPGTGMTFGQMFASDPTAGGLGYEEVTAYADMGDAVTAVGFGGTMGLSFQMNEMLSFGFSYTMQSSLTFEGEASMDMDAQFGQAFERMVGGAMQQGAELATATQGVMTQLTNMGIDMQAGMISDYDVEVEMSWPQEIGFGVAVKPTEKLLLGLDVKYISWEDAMDKFSMKFTDGNNNNINTMMGSKDVSLEMPLEWDNQVVIALGTEYLLNEKVALRAGYNYASNPVPSETLIPIFPAIVEHHLTLGSGYMINDNFEVDFALEINLEKEDDVDSSMIANEYDGSTSSLAETALHLGLTYKF